MIGDCSLYAGESPTQRLSSEVLSSYTKVCQKKNFEIAFILFFMISNDIFSILIFTMFLLALGTSSAPWAIQIVQTPTWTMPVRTTRTLPSTRYHFISSSQMWPTYSLMFIVEARQEIDLRLGAAFTRFQTMRLQSKYDSLGKSMYVCDLFIYIRVHIRA